MWSSMTTKPRQVLVDGAEAVVDPRSQAGRTAEHLARIHHQHRRAMQRRVRGHRVQEGDVVDAGRHVREEVGDPLAALSVLLEVPLGPDDHALALGTATTPGLDFDGLAIQRVELRLVVEGIDLAGSAVHEQEDHGLGPRGHHRGPGRQGTHGGTDRAVRCERPGRTGIHPLQASRPGPPR